MRKARFSALYPVGLLHITILYATLSEISGNLSRMPHEPFQSVEEVADLLEAGEVAARPWIRGGELGPIDIGRGWRIGSSDLGAFLDGHATRSAGCPGDYPASAGSQLVPAGSKEPKP